MYSHRIPVAAGISAIPPATETITGVAKFFIASAIAVALAKWPIPIPLLVARMIVGLPIAQYFSQDQLCKLLNKNSQLFR